MSHMSHMSQMVSNDPSMIQTRATAPYEMSFQSHAAKAGRWAQEMWGTDCWAPMFVIM